ncbi:MAG: LysR family transcriptional regulator [Parvularculaceae bacterium]
MLWELYRVFGATAREGGVAKAAKSLHLSAPTVSRRIQALEAALDTRLFDREPEGFALTPAGRELAALVESMEEAAEAIARRRDSLRASARGAVRIAAGNWISRLILARAGALLESSPELEIEILNTYAFADLSRREADLAIRNRRPEAGRLASRRLAGLSYAVYGLKSYIDARPEAREMHRWPECDWIGYDEDRSGLPTARWVESRINRPPQIRCSQAVNILDAVKAGLGLAVLPCFLEREERDLVRLSPPIDTEAPDIWLTIHEDLRKAPAIRAAADWLVDMFEQERRAEKAAQAPPDGAT